MIKKINFFIFRILYWSTAFFSFFFFLMVCLNVITRYILKTPILASIELSRLFFVWACFLAAGITYYKKGHIAISFITDLFTPSIRMFISKLIIMLNLLFLSALTWWSVQVLIDIWFTNFPILGISQGWLYVPVSITSLTMVLFSLESLFNQPSLTQRSDYA